jgi:hypothetical protein
VILATAIGSFSDQYSRTWLEQTTFGGSNYRIHPMAFGPRVILGVRQGRDRYQLSLMP